MANVARRLAVKTYWLVSQAHPSLVEAMMKIREGGSPSGLKDYYSGDRGAQVRSVIDELRAAAGAFTGADRSAIRAELKLRYRFFIPWPSWWYRRKKFYRFRDDEVYFIGSTLELMLAVLRSGQVTISALDVIVHDLAKCMSGLEVRVGSDRDRMQSIGPIEYYGMYVPIRHYTLEEMMQQLDS